MNVRRMLFYDLERKWISHYGFMVSPFFTVPIEWLTLSFDMPFMLLLSDVRQGQFYAFLLSFWCIFVGEHILVSN